MAVDDFCLSIGILFLVAYAAVLATFVSAIREQRARKNQPAQIRSPSLRL